MPETTKAVLYIHGKGGSAEEAHRYKPLFIGYDVYGLDYLSTTPWETKEEIQREYKKLVSCYDSVVLVANSIGAYFSMNALQGETIERAFFISPILDMQKLIEDMMGWAGVSDAELREKGLIETEFGETLSWEYLEYVRNNPIKWTVPMEILYAGRDALTSRGTVDAFVASHNANLTVMEDGEHWFHTDEQLSFLDEWIVRTLHS